MLAFQSSLPRAAVCFGCAPAGQFCRRQQKRGVQTGCSKPSLTPDPVPGEKCPNPAKFAPYWHPRELILPSVYPTLPFPFLGKLSAFFPGSTAQGAHGEGGSHPCRDLGFQAAETAPRAALAHTSAPSSAAPTDARSKETETKPEK